MICHARGLPLRKRHRGGFGQSRGSRVVAVDPVDCVAQELTEHRVLEGAGAIPHQQRHHRAVPCHRGPPHERTRLAPTLARHARGRTVRYLVKGVLIKRAVTIGIVFQEWRDGVGEVRREVQLVIDLERLDTRAHRMLGCGGGDGEAALAVPGRGETLAAQSTRCVQEASTDGLGPSFPARPGRDRVVQHHQGLPGFQEVDQCCGDLGVRTHRIGWHPSLQVQAGQVVQQDRVPLAGELRTQPPLGAGLGGVRPNPATFGADAGDGGEELVHRDPVSAGDDQKPAHVRTLPPVRSTYCSLANLSTASLILVGSTMTHATITSGPREGYADHASRDLILDLHRRMVRIRLFEESAGKLVESGDMPGFLHLYVGQEAVAAGVMSVLGDADQITSTHRGHGHAIAKGAEFRPMFAELYGKTTGYCKGRGGSMHIVDMNRGMLGANAIVGGGIPIAVGAAFASQYRGDGGVAASFFGDGATNIGAFHEAVNMAAVWDLPVLFVCENNGYAEFTSQERHMKLTDIAERAASYGIPGVIVDGMDALAVRTVALEAVERARRGEGPTLIEAKTYRYFDHQGIKGMRIPYRDPAEVEAWKSRDCIRLIETIGVERGLVSADEFAQVWAQTEADVADGIQFARTSPDPDPADILDDVYTV